MKILNNGFGFYQISDLPVSERTDFGRFEEFYKKPIPKMLKKCYSIYDIGRGKMQSEKVFLPRQGRCYEFCDLAYTGKHSDYVYVYELVSLGESIDSMRNAFEEDDEIWKMDVACIGSCMSNMVLMVGIGEHNADHIFLENTSIHPNGQRLWHVTDDIFDFFKHWVLTERPSLSFASYADLYRNWNEDFWRIRGEE